MLSVPDGPHPNPFVSLLVAAVEPDVDVRMFSWRAALLGRYDVFHVQWPESLVGWRASARAAARCLACVALAGRWRLTRTVVVRTVHNLAPHEAQRWYQRAAGRLLARAEAARIYLTASSLATADDPHGHVIKHGRYRQWFDALEVPVPPRDDPEGPDGPTVLFFGMLRPYKGVEELLAAFGHLERPARLRVLGRPHTAQYQTQIQTLAAADQRTELDLRHVPDEELWAALHRATLVVLPFREITNSGSLILALDAGVPVLVSSSPTTKELAEEVGDQWLRTYDGTLSAKVLDEALTWAATRPGPAAGPDLSSRDQRSVGREYVALYRTLLARYRKSGE